MSWERDLEDVRARVERELVERALTDRGALEELLTSMGLAAHSRRLAYEVATTGLLLEPVATARSRLGGPALLPADEQWPVTDGGTPLSFLAALDLSELRSDGRLPDDGWLLFFAALDPDCEGLVDEAENAAGAAARVLVVPPGSEPVSADPPAALRRNDLAVLEHRPVRARDVLTMPDGYDAGAVLDLDVYAARTYDTVTDLLRSALDADLLSGVADGAAWPSRHWVLGHATGTQGHSVAPDSVLLLHIQNDPSLGFEFLDGGTIQFRIPATALAARDWSRVVALAESS